ncbi:MAG TPA: STAS domain-containing protein, partial [Micromonosporaceae bacterium]
MSGELSVDVEHAQPVAVIRPHGVLDAYTAADLRAALLECLAEQPSGVVVDGSDLEVADDVALSVLSSVAQESQRWPGTRFAIAGAGERTVSAAERMGVARYIKICPDRDTAVRELAQWPAPPMRRDRIAADRDAPGHARAAVVEFCQQHGVGGDGDVAQLVASELVTNAVVHAGTPIDLTLRLLPPVLHIAVRDKAGGRPRITDVVDESAQSGRGLLLVDALATQWGSFIPNVGKVVWATVRIRPVAPAPF